MSFYWDFYLLQDKIMNRLESRKSYKFWRSWIVNKPPKLEGRHFLSLFVSLCLQWHFISYLFFFFFPFWRYFLSSSHQFGTLVYTSVVQEWFFVFHSFNFRPLFFFPRLLLKLKIFNNFSGLNPHGWPVVFSIMEPIFLF